MREIRVRFAPSPTGYLHVGGARTALFNYLFARKYNGTFILRIEDTDVQRSSDNMVAGILEGLRWLGLEWDAGPFFQSERIPLYQERALALIESGHAYYCFCSTAELTEKRRQAAEEKRDWQYDGTCRRRSPTDVATLLRQGTPGALRFKVPEEGVTVFADSVFGRLEVQNQGIEDFVLLRSDGQPTYHLSVVVDDADMGISHVIRGVDHLSNTPKQVLLYQAMGLDPPVFAHLPLILGPDRSRLSKRHGATSVTAYRDMGFIPSALRNFLALLGWSAGNAKQEIFSPSELIDRFSLEGISKANAIFDFDKALWVNAQFLRSMTGADLLPVVREVLREEGLWRDDLQGPEREWFLHLIDLLKVRTRTLKDFAEAGRPYLSNEYPFDPKAVEKNLRHTELKELLPELADRFARLEPFSLESTERVLRHLAEEKHIKTGILINAVRTALTGSAVTPGIFDVILAVGKERTIDRLRRAVTLVGERPDE